ncbi:hypothetical protein SEUCBS140593_009410 [Sporothrix eucalyptigena]|uniref:Zn(2)-C6 fungal-type domain-containing protein n=1 Tax=Sporothrix eucalyptigena TaxID=1812306 RepID=A0ABP0CXT1_9PEZI
MNGNKRQRADSDAATSSARGSERPEKAAKPLLTRACAECKRQKIRCFFAAGQSACNKCSKSGIQCVPHNFAQKYMDDDAIWKADAAETISRLTAAVNCLLEQNNLPQLATFGTGDKSTGASGRSNMDEHGDATTLAVLGEATAAVQVISPAMSQASSTAAAATTAASGNFISEGPSADLQEDVSDLVPPPMNNLYNLTGPSKSYLIRVDPACVNGPDFISRGVVSLDEAQFLFSHFITHINPLLWDGILCSHTTLEAARASSSLLVATVLTVAAMHLSGDRKDARNALDTKHQNGGQNQQQQQQQRQQKPTILHATYDAFVQLMRASCLLRSQNLDDVRGLCIGAFYLTSLSWALCSRAIRVATEMNVHKSSLQFAARDATLPTSSASSTSTSVPAPSSYGHDQFERVQLWYVLYVCDHQFALAYGRPPMMHDDAAIRNANKFLAVSESLSFSAVTTAPASALHRTSFATGPVPSPVPRNAHGNRWLVAQVKLFRILAGAYFLYGCDPDLALNGEDYQRLQSFNLSLDQWRLEEQQHTRRGSPGHRTQPVVLPGDGPSRGYQAGDQQTVSNKVTTLYYHLARFQLNSLSLRGISARGDDGTAGAGQLGTDTKISMSWERQEAANNAITAAASTIRLIIEDTDLRSLQIGMPIFVHAMIAVCASFLLKMAVVFSADGSSCGTALPLPHDLSRHGLNFHTKNALADVESLVRVLSAVADITSQQHVVRQVVTGLRELLQRFRAGAEPDTFVYLRSTIHSGVHSSMQNENSMQSGVAAEIMSTHGGALDYGGSDAPRTAPPAYSMTPHGNGELTNMHSNASRGRQQQGHDQQSMTGGNMGTFNSGNEANNNGVPCTALPHDQMLQDGVMQPGAALGYQDDPFNLMGDLDWRFNDAFLWGIQAEPPYA